MEPRSPENMADGIYMHSSAKISFIYLSLVLLVILAGCSNGRIDVEPAAGVSTTGDNPSTGENPTTGGTTTGTKNAFLSWGTPTLYTDGTPVAPGNIKEYRVYFGTSSGSYSSSPVSNQTTSIQVKDIITRGTGTYYFVVTAIDLTDVESDFSNEVSAVLN